MALSMPPTIIPLSYLPVLLGYVHTTGMCLCTFELKPTLYLRLWLHTSDTTYLCAIPPHGWDLGVYTCHARIGT